SILFANKITLYLNIIFSDRLFLTRPHKIALLPIQMVLKLTGLLDKFDGKLYSANDVSRPKPFPDVYLYAAEQMNTNPEDCAVIEDSVTGVQAAYAAGMTVFGYAHQSDACGGLRQRTALAEAGAKIVFNDMQQLAQLL
ncbi:MAG: HAD-IA family hydrolase, partial [Nostoc sp.]